MKNSLVNSRSRLLTQKTKESHPSKEMVKLAKKEIESQKIHAQNVFLTKLETDKKLDWI
ncbi:MAG: hypothetical protein HKM04_01560 [Legionellales bacterium]|nr:hypothetical protein [Legionellales bacterium]